VLLGLLVVTIMADKCKHGVDALFMLGDEPMCINCWLQIQIDLNNSIKKKLKDLETNYSLERTRIFSEWDSEKYKIDKSLREIK
jgi:hypothetical protein